MRLPTKLGRVALLAAGLALGLATPAVAPGCIFNDYCIVVTTPGTNWCVTMEDTLMWPVGQPDLAEPVSIPDAGAPLGCRCFNDADAAILADGLPADVFGGLVDEIETATRNKCALAVPPGFDHNCYIEDGVLAPGFGDVFAQSEPSDDCIGSCGYIKPPPLGSCGADPDPYECNEEYGGDMGSDTATDTGDSDTGVDRPTDAVPGPTEVLR